MATKKYLDDNGLTYYHSKVKTLLGGKVDKETGKGLSTNDYTTTEKNKLAGIAAGAEVNVQSDWDETDTNSDAYIQNKPTIPTVNDAALTIQKNGTTVATFTANSATPTTANIAVPTNNNELTNGAGYQTATEVQDAINDALEGITGIDFQVVQTLPATGEKGVIYLISNSGSAPNIYDEYIWLSATSTYEKIGTTDIDLSGYQLSSELIAVTNAEIDSIVAS